MKNLITIMALFSLMVVSAQTIIPIEQKKAYQGNEAGQNYYYKDINGVFNKFLGTWKYQNTSVSPTEIVEVVFYKKEMEDFSGNYYKDFLYARFKYTKNGQVVFNNLIALMGSPPPLYIFGGFFKDPANTNKIFLQYGEPTDMDDKRKDWLNLEYLPGTPAKLSWKMEWYPLDENVTAPEMPATMTLTKVN
jgi:hypothetical protein